MKTILCALLALSGVVASAAPGAQVGTIQTLQGKTYRQCKILQRDADGIAFSHAKGTARILFSDLPLTTRRELGYDAKAAAELDLSRKQQRQDKLEAQRQQQKKLAEQQQQASRFLAMQQYSQWQQQAMYGYGYAYQAPYYTGPIPAVGFAAPGWSATGYPYWNHGGSGHGSHNHSGNRGWENVGNGGIVPGTDGIYVNQGGGFNFTGFPQIHYSPTLGYYNPGYYAPPPQNSLGTFGFVPGLGPSPPPAPAVVPGVHIHGSAAIPAHR